MSLVLAIVFYFTKLFGAVLFTTVHRYKTHKRTLVIMLGLFLIFFENYYRQYAIIWGWQWN